MRSLKICIHNCWFILFFVICLSVLSCYVGKNDPLHKLEELTEDIRLHHQEYTIADWKEAYARYEQIAADMENYHYTKEDAEKIGKLEGECVGYFMKSAVKSLDGLGNEIKGFFEGIGEVTKENDDCNN